MTRAMALVALAGAVGLSGCAGRQKQTVPAYKSTVILGTWLWDVESNRQELGDTNDFWWQHANDTERYLVPKNGTRAKLVSDRDFDAIDSAFVQGQDLSEARISGSDKEGPLTPGAIVVFLTTEGNMGKLQVEKYRALHDFSFPEAAHLPERWKLFAINATDIERYHLQVRWQLFR